MNDPRNENSQPTQAQEDTTELAARYWWQWWAGMSKSEHPKPLVSNNLFYNVAWHFWTIGPCLITAVLLTLNIHNYAIGTYIGNDQNSTLNFLAVIQGCAKIHEVIMLIGLVNIVQQVIQRSLIKDGLLLGLLGAELSLGSIFFILSQEFRAAFSYGVSKWHDQKKIFLLVALIFIACILSMVVGPASAVLMVPHLGWYHEQNLVWDNDSGHTPSCFPYFLIDPRLGEGINYYEDVSEQILFSEPIPDYFDLSMNGFETDHRIKASDENRQVTHQLNDGGMPVIINSSTTWNRTMRVDSRWKGETNFSAAIQYDTISLISSLTGYLPYPKNKGSDARFVADTTEINSSTVCRGRQKLFCNSSRVMTENSTDWCFQSVSRDPDEVFQHRSQELLLLTNAGNNTTGYSNNSNFWITEGPRTTNNKFTDTIVFVLQDSSDPTLLVVCSTSATLDVVTATSVARQFAAQQVSAHRDLYYFRPSNDTTPVPPQTIRYHDNWLDMIFYYRPDDKLIKPNNDPISNAADYYTNNNFTREYPPTLINKTYPQRNSSQLTLNPGLIAWASMAQAVLSWQESTFSDSNVRDQESGIVEIILGGAFISMLSRIYPSTTQYSKSHAAHNTLNPTLYAPELMPEAIIDCHYINKTLSIYRYVYSYQRSSISSIFSMVALLFHAVIAILGSLWQFRKGSIIKACRTVPEYGALCLGTNPQKGATGNTRVGFESKEALMTLVIKKDQVKPDDLELDIIPATGKAHGENKHGIQGKLREGVPDTAPTSS